MRTDADRFATPPTPLTIRLGGKAFDIAIQKRGKTARWRREFIGNIATDEEIGAIAKALTMWTSDQVHQASEMPIRELLSFLLHGLGDRFYSTLDMVYTYDSEAFTVETIQWCNENAYEEELITALMQIARVVFGPFAQGVSWAMTNMIRAETKETDTSAD